ncbi:hypothetical protein Pmani_032793 [Petrolisthes manimaculis]|uniref:USP domain-containing protein n=1 Tax=Petrolisthes manimaculis TaxID=1843537 RepID=A0AAE1TQQ7_9EUCA|nr:hypothetical protein Pmani_032793 [Petrolisthes manimaculis]
MTALDNNVPDRHKSRPRSLRRKRTINPATDISPAPEPRTSHRFLRTYSNGDSSDDKNKTPPMIRKISLSRNKLNRRTLPHSGGGQGGIGGAATGGGGGGGGDGGRETTTTNSNTNTTGGAIGTTGGIIGTTGLGKVAGVCPLANMGNTCFLNSVLYALRFLPGFTHDLHHLHVHLQQAAGDQSDTSLDRRIQFLSELHRVFVSLCLEERGGSEKRIPAFQPYDFLDALRVVNPMFEGNRQQDAHELLHCLLDQLCHLPQDLLLQGLPNAADAHDRDTHDRGVGPPEPKRPRRRSERIQAIEEDSSKAVDVVGSKFVGVMRLETRCFECEKVTGREETFLEVCVPVKTKADFDEDECVTEEEVFMSALSEEECLRDNNKYWCDVCLHHNEARRSVHYSQLPQHLVIHVKRFSAYHRNMFTAKCSEAMPAPLELSCFCRDCLSDQIQRAHTTTDVHTDTMTGHPTHTPKIRRQQTDTDTTGRPKNKSTTTHTRQQTDTAPTADTTGRHNKSKGAAAVPPSVHLPYHLTAVVCHLGASLSSGHYLSFVRLSALHSSTCADQQHTHTQPQTATTQTHTAPHTQTRTQTHTATQTRTQTAAAGKIDCQWMKCCGLSLEHHIDNDDERDRDSLWLECDDEKVKVVTAGEVTQMMHTTLITPYLLFYSRL